MPADDLRPSDGRTDGPLDQGWAAQNAFETTLLVRFGHVDPAGIAYYPRIFDYLHDVFEELWERHVGQRYYDLLLNQGVGFPLVHTEADFHSPLRFGQRPLVRVTCFQLGRSSLGLRYRIVEGERLCVEARMVTVCVSMETMAPLEIPPKFRGAFEELAEPETR